MAIISFITEGILVYSLAFLTLMPDYYCTSKGHTYRCTREETCENNMTFYINKESPSSLDNMVDILGLRCVESW
jgi:hypothetical protein